MKDLIYRTFFIREFSFTDCIIFGLILGIQNSWVLIGVLFAWLFMSEPLNKYISERFFNREY